MDSEHASTSNTDTSIEQIEIARIEHRSGPLPTPEDFGRYEEVYPGAADRIISMAEKAQDSAIAENKRKDWMAFVTDNTILLIPALIIMFLAGIGAFLLSSGRDIAGYVSLFGPTGIASIVYAYNAFSRHSKKK